MIGPDIDIGIEVSTIKSRIIENPSLKNLSQRKIDAELADISNLKLDEINIGQISHSDREILAKCYNLRKISFISTNLSDLRDLPNCWDLESI